jgi:thymidylate synthase (FAD)
VSTLAEYGQAVEEKKVVGLIRSLMKQKHGTPFEDGYFRFRIAAPRGVRDEHVRHRIGWSFSSASSRYREIPQHYYIPPPHRPLKKVDNFKSMRPTYEPYEEARYQEYADGAKEVYLWLAEGIEKMKDLGFMATEEIRWFNPDGQIMPYIARCNPRSLMHFLALRTHDENANHVSYPMWEIEQVARYMEAEFARCLPITHAAFVEYGREAP